MVNIYKKQNLGWTLVEVLIIITILGILSLSVYELYLQIWRFYRLSNAQRVLQQEARNILDLIVWNLRNGRSDTIVISQNSGQPYYSKIQFQTIEGSTVTYYQQNRKLVQVIDNNTKVLSNNVTYFTAVFPKSYEMNIVSIALTLEMYVYDIKKKALHMASEKVMVMN